MGRFDEIVGEVMSFAKTAADVATKKTGEVVGISKLKYMLKQSEWDLQKAYAKLGAIAFEKTRSNEDFREAEQLACSEIEEIKEKIEYYEDALRKTRKMKVCDKCGHDNDNAAVYCGQCGAPLKDEPIDIDYDDAPTEEPCDEPMQAEVYTDTKVEE